MGDRLDAVIALIVVTLLAVPGSISQGQPPRPAAADEPTPPPQADAADPAPDRERIEYWVGQLGSDQYLRRKRASEWLVRAGPAAVPVLVDSLDGGDLEVTRRVIDALQEVALAQSPKEDGGAWGALQSVARSGVGSQASRAQAAIDEVRHVRGQLAREMLPASGIFIGQAEFVVLARSATRQIVQIDDDWQGDESTLQWLKWVDDVHYARVVGKSINPTVLEHLVQMPDLETITLLDGDVSPEVLACLDRMERIEDLEFRYVSLRPELVDQIADLPIRSSLSLMGTGLPNEAVDRLRASRPGLQIEFRQGGFLGVTCDPTQNLCQITDVVPDSAAEQAGLISGDVIIGIDDFEVEEFADLQAAINEHLPGDHVSIRYSRAGVIAETSAQLGRLRQSVRPMPNR